MNARKDFPLDQLVICEDCDALYRRIPLAPGGRAHCTRCHAELYRDHRGGFESTIALAVAGLIVFIMASAGVLISMNVQGVGNEVTLWQTIFAPQHYRLAVVSVLVAVLVFFVPLFQLLLTLYLAASLQLGYRPPGFVVAMHALRHLRPWGMVEVFLLGMLVAVAKLAGLSAASPGLGLWGFVALTIVMTLLAQRDLRHYWDAAESCEDARHTPRVSAT